MVGITCRELVMAVIIRSGTRGQLFHRTVAARTDPLPDLHDVLAHKAGGTGQKLQRMAPRENTSARLSTLLASRICSGPCRLECPSHSCSSDLTDSPRQPWRGQSPPPLGSESSVTAIRMLWGLRSRWTSPWAWAAAMPLRRSRSGVALRMEGLGLKQGGENGPATNSITSAGTPSITMRSVTLTTLGCLSEDWSLLKKETPLTFSLGF